MKYPTREGLPIPVREALDYEPMHLRHCNNHHSLWTARNMGKLVVTQTLRDLAEYQDVMPRTAHQRLHDTYDPPEIDIQAAFDRVMQAYDDGELMREGSAYRPHYRYISLDKINRISKEYEQLGLSRPIIDLGAA